MSKRKNQFDERQRIEQGKAYRNAFLTLLASLYLCSGFNTFYGKPMLDLFSITMISSWISFSVFFTTCILRSAIESIKYQNTWKWLALTWGGCGLGMTIISAITLIERPIINDGVLSNAVHQAFWGICWMEICVVYWIKHFADRRKAKQTENA